MPLPAKIYYTDSGRTPLTALSKVSRRLSSPVATVGSTLLNQKPATLSGSLTATPKDSVWELGGRGTRNNIISTPVVYEDKVFVAVGQDPEHGEGVGHLWCIDASQTGDITETAGIWHFGDEQFNRTMSTVAIVDGLLYISDLGGFLYCLDVDTGDPYWTHDTFAAIWGSPYVVDGKVYLGDEDGDVVILKTGKTKQVLFETNMDSAVYTTPVAKNGVLYIVTRNMLIADRREEMNLSRKITEARRSLDAHVREIVKWHFSPKTGCPFWLEFAKNLDFDPRKEIGGYADLKCLGHFEDEWLRGGPVRRWVPKAYADEPIYVFETGGSTGVPKSRISIRDFHIDYELFSETLSDEGFPTGSDWLMLGADGTATLTTCR